MSTFCITNVRGPVSNKCAYSFITTADLWMVWFSYIDTLVIQQMSTIFMRYLLKIANCRGRNQILYYISTHSWINFV